MGSKRVKGNTRIITDFLKMYWLKYVVGCIFLLLSAYVQAFNPKLLGIIIDLLDSSTIDSQFVIYNLVLLIVVAFLAFVTRYIWRYFIIGNARNLECYLRQRLFKHFQSLPVQFYNNKKTGDLMAYAINDISAVRMSFGPALAMTVNGVCLSAISIISMVRSVNLSLTLVSLLPIPIIVIAMFKIGSLVQLRFKAVQENFAAISDRVQENISGIRVIKSYVQEQQEVQNFDVLNERIKKSNIKMVRVSSFLSPMIQVCFGVSFMINLIYGSSLVRSGVISLGDFVAFNGYLTMIMMPIISIGRVINLTQKGIASYKRLKVIFQEETDITDEQADKSLKTIAEDIEIKALSFKYPNCEEYALHNIDITLTQGKTLGIIGKTGSGKTTLVNLLLRLYKLEEGSIQVGGRKIEEYPLEVLRKCIGYVPQDNFLFSANIKENISFFEDIYTDEEIENATKLSCVYDNIKAFPKDFDTVIGDRGVNLSGGQKQRISIARAIIKEPRLLILDDALSAVDTKTEEEIINNFIDILKDKMGIIIAHRISAVKHADEIVVLEHGQIIERGKHEELLAKMGSYYGIYQEQFKEETRRRMGDEAK
ncbi:MAG: ABC transporter ATP-binding protein [Lutisporaceae bacterium]